MFDNIAKKVIKMLIKFLDRKGNLMALSFGIDDNTDYHIIVERWNEENHTHSFGIKIEKMV